MCWAFAYGLGAGMLALACVPDMAFALHVQLTFDTAFDKVLANALPGAARYRLADGLSKDDIAALTKAGLSDSEIKDVTSPQAVPSDAGAAGVGGDAAVQTDGAGGATPGVTTHASVVYRSGSPESSPPSTVIPTGSVQEYRYDYELTYYVNDISYSDVQVAAEYGQDGIERGSYTYGNGRISAQDADGTLTSYLYDGRGSVAQTYSGGVVTSSLSYDPFGKVLPQPGSGVDAAAGSGASQAAGPVNGGSGQANTAVTEGAEGTTGEAGAADAATGASESPALGAAGLPYYAYNGEEYSPATGLYYLRARYYDPAAAGFTTSDPARGSVASINSQGRYAYAGSDPVNNVDPSGASPVSGGAYERAMGQLGGINELYNFYVGRTLESAQSQAAGAFSAQLARAYGTDYRSLSAINSIAQVSQQAADAYIAKGAVAALAAGASWGCSPGALTGAAVMGFAATVSAAKDSVNAQISAVKANKRAQYGQYQAWLAYQAWLRQQQAYQAELERQAQAAPQGISQRTLGQLTRLEAMERKTAASPYMNYAPMYPLRELVTTPFNAAGIGASLSWARMASAFSAQVVEVSDKRMVSQRFYGYGLGKNALVQGKRPTEEESWEAIHLTLDILGMIPVAGVPFDIANSIIYAARGDSFNAVLTLAAAVPIAGMAAPLAKWSVKAAKAAKASKILPETMDAANKATNTVKKIGKGSPGFAENLVKHEDILSNKTYTRSTGKMDNFESATKGKTAAEADFYAKKPTNIRSDGKAIYGDLPDGSVVNLHIGSSTNGPTVEIYNPATGRSIKIRY